MFIPLIQQTLCVSPWAESVSVTKIRIRLALVDSPSLGCCFSFLHATDCIFQKQLDAVIVRFAHTYISFCNPANPSSKSEAYFPSLREGTAFTMMVTVGIQQPDTAHLPRPGPNSPGDFCLLLALFSGPSLVGWGRPCRHAVRKPQLVPAERVHSEAHGERS